MSGQTLAVDCGGSGTRLLHSARRFKASLPPVSWELGGPELLVQAVVEGWLSLGSPPTDAVGIGIAATPDLATAARLAAEIGRQLGADRVLIANDAVTGHLGALRGEAGVALIVGTGVACVRWDPQRECAPRFFDGHGPLIADAGSAAWIGRQAVRAVLDAAQDGQPPAALAERVGLRWGNLAEVPARLHALANPVGELGDFGREVLACADTDPVADEVVERAAAELARTVHRAAVVRLEGAVTGSEVKGSGVTGCGVRVALGGGLLADDSVLARRLKALLAADPYVEEVVAAHSSPLRGARALLRLSHLPPGVVGWSAPEAKVFAVSTSTGLTSRSVGQ